MSSSLKKSALFKNIENKSAKLAWVLLLLLIFGTLVTKFANFFFLVILAVLVVGLLSRATVSHYRRKNISTNQVKT